MSSTGEATENWRISLGLKPSNTSRRSRKQMKYLPNIRRAKCFLIDLSVQGGLNENGNANSENLWAQPRFAVQGTYKTSASCVFQPRLVLKAPIHEVIWVLIKLNKSRTSVQKLPWDSRNFGRTLTTQIKSGRSLDTSRKWHVLYSSSTIRNDTQRAEYTPLENCI